jgi:hypothetical protein
MSYERHGGGYGGGGRRRRRGEMVCISGPPTTTLNTVQTTTIIMTTGEKFRSHQTRSLRLLSSNSAKWFVFPYLRIAQLTVITQDAEQELPQLAAKLQSQEQPNIPAIAEGFRLAYALVFLRIQSTYCLV